MNGALEFCEVFLTEARVPPGRVHRRGRTAAGGWRRRRCSTSAIPSPAAALPGLVTARSGSAGDLDRTVGEVIERARRSGQGP